MRIRRRHSLVCLLLVAAAACGESEIGGHGKLRLIASAPPSDSLLREIGPATFIDGDAELRLNAAWRRGGWRLETAYTLFELRGDLTEASLSLPSTGNRYPDDRRRLFDLTHVFSDDGNRRSLHRLDRLSLSLTSEDWFLRVGRQVLSWGNGLFFSPMDLVNPFDPAAIDTEYKIGDDMLYLQRLFANGDDLQAAVVVRRDPASGSVEADASSALMKYHAFAGAREIDFVLGQHYGEAVFGAGLVQSVGDAVVRGDAVLSENGSPRFVANASYSWVGFGRNMNGAIEYFFNGFGQRAGRYSPAGIGANRELVKRLERGELFNLGRHYLAASVAIETTPLLTVSPTVFANVGDRSALLQLTARYSLADEAVFTASLNLPVGPAGTEFAGLPSGIDGLSLATGPGLFLQIAAYF